LPDEAQAFEARSSDPEEIAVLVSEQHEIAVRVRSPARLVKSMSAADPCLPVAGHQLG
jgi:hypothetical protein